MAPARAQESIEISDNRFTALRITLFPRGFQATSELGSPYAKTAFVRRAASMSVAMSEQIEEAIAPPSAEPHSSAAAVHSELGSSASDSAPLRAGRHYARVARSDGGPDT